MLFAPCLPPSFADPNCGHERKNAHFAQKQKSKNEKQESKSLLYNGLVGGATTLLLQQEQQRVKTELNRKQSICPPHARAHLTPNVPLGYLFIPSEDTTSLGFTRNTSPRIQPSPGPLHFPRDPPPAVAPDDDIFETPLLAPPPGEVELVAPARDDLFRFGGGCGYKHREESIPKSSRLGHCGRDQTRYQVKRERLGLFWSTTPLSTKYTTTCKWALHNISWVRSDEKKHLRTKRDAAFCRWCPAVFEWGFPPILLSFVPQDFSAESELTGFFVNGFTT